MSRSTEHDFQFTGKQALLAKMARYFELAREASDPALASYAQSQAELIQMEKEFEDSKRHCKIPYDGLGAIAKTMAFIKNNTWLVLPRIYNAIRNSLISLSKVFKIGFAELKAAEENRVNGLDSKQIKKLAKMSLKDIDTLIAHEIENGYYRESPSINLQRSASLQHNRKQQPELQRSATSRSSDDKTSRINAFDGLHTSLQTFKNSKAKEVPNSVVAVARNGNKKPSEQDSALSMVKAAKQTILDHLRSTGQGRAADAAILDAALNDKTLEMIAKILVENNKELGNLYDLFTKSMDMPEAYEAVCNALAEAAEIAFVSGADKVNSDKNIQNAIAGRFKEVFNNEFMKPIEDQKAAQIQAQLKEAAKEEQHAQSSPVDPALAHAGESAREQAAIKKATRASLLDQIEAATNATELVTALNTYNEYQTRKPDGTPGVPLVTPEDSPKLAQRLNAAPEGTFKKKDINGNNVTVFTKEDNIAFAKFFLDAADKVDNVHNNLDTVITSAFANMATNKIDALSSEASRAARKKEGSGFNEPAPTIAAMPEPGKTSGQPEPGEKAWIADVLAAGDTPEGDTPGQEEGKEGEQEPDAALMNIITRSETRFTEESHGVTAATHKQPDNTWIRQEGTELDTLLEASQAGKNNVVSEEKAQQAAKDATGASEELRAQQDKRQSSGVA